MKRALYILIAAVSLASCKDFLDVQPDLQVDESISITNTSTAETALNGLYNRMGNNSYYGSNFQALSYLSGGDIQWTGSQGAPQEVVLHNLTADNGYVGSAWSAIYQTILQSNYILEKVPGLTDPLLTEARRNQFLGEAYGIRALSYFDLVRGWGGVPLILSATKTAEENASVKRSSAAEVYTRVLEDLNTAEGLLDETVNRNRVTKKTVWALKARYYLYNQQWQLAEEFAGKLINDRANYQLIKPYSSFFTALTTTAESVFELSYSIANTNNHSNWWLPPALGGRREWAPSDQLVQLLNNPVTGGNRNAAINKTSAGLWYGQVYYRNPVGTDPAYVIRTAELYLIRAEALANQNRIAEALTDLNTVRDRAGLAPVNALTTADILLAISNERRLEFAFEADRWFDLKRTGRIAEQINLTDANKYLFPIPTAEILTNPALAGDQNPGY